MPMNWIFQNSFSVLLDLGFPRCQIFPKLFGRRFWFFDYFLQVDRFSIFTGQWLDWWPYQSLTVAVTRLNLLAGYAVYIRKETTRAPAATLAPLPWRTPTSPASSNLPPYRFSFSILFINFEVVCLLLLAAAAVVSLWLLFGFPLCACDGKKTRETTNNRSDFLINVALMKATSEQQRRAEDRRKTFFYTIPL
jgi:hypothetical protein